MTDTHEIAEVLARVRQRGPLVHCMTNIVVAGFTANVLLALDASPAMVENTRESAQFAAIADGLLVNLGTLTSERAEAMRAAAGSAHDAGTPWVLDPVAVGGLDYRTGLAKELLEAGPHIIRGNASEVISLAGGAGAGRGVDSSDGPEAAAPAAESLVSRPVGAVAVSGPIDYVTDGTQRVRVHNGDPVMTRVTGVGCALGAVVAACAAVVESPLTAAVAGTAIMTIAAEHAASTSAGPGSFAVHLIDALSLLEPSDIEKELRL
ncbi:hydroxyethylthiazole kinase [Leekyejoonella antrihumi]|uniref:Hydroxyethylthiazole kinase n=1 Tax=Leekyejoonella antrihumi TaxID=1660198 RepID=A0A563E2B6_9MICO|nr:hydroxyethylthiazole kinase [Leekyejoonella antrihumi]TWP36332.1 hydroxyethylthiazole kinase [Leekyejoonella antrihumi]